MTPLDRRQFLGASAASLTGFASARAASRPIDEQGFVRIGGIDQWIAIQGRDAANPAILYLHGGAGEAQSPFLKTFLPWQTQYTVVNWDQRGSGKTYGRNRAATPDMTIDRLAADAVEVAAYACRRLGVSKVILVGQSWGAMLGLKVVKQKPSLFHAFVGTGQPVYVAFAVADRERWARAQASALGDKATLKALDETARLPLTDPRRINATRRYRMGGADLDYVKRMEAAVGSPSKPASPEAADWWAGYAFSNKALAGADLLFDIRTLGADYPIPVFVIQGRDDHVVSVSAAKAWLESVRAPAKAYVAIDGGHYACFTNTPAFLDALRKDVLPVVRRT
jgi:pimeloyl-ACP methyl ester carboxylesterase